LICSLVRLRNREGLLKQKPEESLHHVGINVVKDAWISIFELREKYYPCASIERFGDPRKNFTCRDFPAAGEIMPTNQANSSTCYIEPLGLPKMARLQSRPPESFHRGTNTDGPLRPYMRRWRHRFPRDNQ